MKWPSDMYPKTPDQLQYERDREREILRHHDEIHYQMLRKRERIEQIATWVMWAFTAVLLITLFTVGTVLVISGN